MRRKKILIYPHLCSRKGGEHQQKIVCSVVAAESADRHDGAAAL
jgi:hypothetical protein